MWPPASLGPQCTPGTMGIGNARAGGWGGVGDFLAGPQNSLPCQPAVRDIKQAVMGGGGGKGREARLDAHQESKGMARQGRHQPMGASRQVLSGKTKIRHHGDSALEQPIGASPKREPAQSTTSGSEAGSQHRHIPACITTKGDKPDQSYQHS